MNMSRTYATDDLKRRKLKSFIYLWRNKRGTTKNTTFFNFNHFLVAIKSRNPPDVISRGFLVLIYVVC